MSQNLFEVELGIKFEGASLIAGPGTPSGNDLSGSVGIGSMYHDTTSGELWIKKVAGIGSPNWSKIALYSEVANRSWREPVKVSDNTSLVIPTETAGNPINVDGVVINDTESVLFRNTTVTTNRNIFFYDQATGTFVEDVNQESAGDQVYVISGSSAGKTFAFNSDTSIWVQNDSSSLDEEGYIRAFIGKSGVGNVLPSYSSQNYVANGDNLQTAIGKLDTQSKTNADNIANEISDRTTAVSNLQTEVNAIETGAGLNSDGSYSAPVGSNYLSSATSLKSAETLLDTQLKSVADLADASATTLNSQGILLDAARTEKFESTVTTSTIIDFVYTEQVVACKWILYTQGNGAGNAGNRELVEILAVHNGTSTVDATGTPDFTKYAKLRMGTITGLSVDIVLAGAGASQKMQLVVSSTMAVDVRAIREVIKW